MIGADVAALKRRLPEVRPAAPGKQRN
jgi:hypothetical protein